MPRIAKELSAIEVQRLAEPGLHAVGVVPGLHLQVSRTGARSWVLRVKVGAKRRDIGLGGYPAVPLASARQHARDKRQEIAEGKDPIQERKRRQSALIAQQAKDMTFAIAMQRAIADLGDGWSNAKHAQQWTNTLNTYASPILGAMLVQDIDTAHVLKVLRQPIDPKEPSGRTLWTHKTVTAARLRGRMETVLNWAKTHGLRSGENPARWKGHLDNILPKPSKVAKEEHHKAVTIDSMPWFFAELRQQSGSGAQALQFLILTAARSGEVRGATWSEIDLDGSTWTIPAARMKAGQEHRVALSKAAKDLLRALPRVEGTDLVFPSTRNTKLSDMTLSAVMRRMGRAEVPHGFRSTFRDWVAERTSYPGDLAEKALAHALSSKVEAAYRRGDMLAKRAAMMEDWADFCTRAVVPAKVLPIRSRRGA